MIKEIRVEEIAKKDEFLKTKLLTRAEVKNAIDLVIKQIDANMEYFKEKFPSSATKNNQYGIIENIEWTDGFWTGLLWLFYEYTGDEKYRKLADKMLHLLKTEWKKI